MEGISCKNIESKLIAYVNEELPQVEMEYIHKHIEGCENCLKETSELKEVLGAIEATPDLPSPQALRHNFEEMLRLEKNVSGEELTVIPVNGIRKLWNIPFIQIAASIAILAVGIWIGTQLQLQPNNTEVAELKNDLQDMKQLVLFSMLEKSSASERIKAVYSVSEFANPSDEVLDALIETLNTDHNVNVRLAAISALSRFSANTSIRQKTIDALSNQNDVIVQLALINLLVSWEEKKATEAFEDLLKKEETPEVVKEQAEIGLQMLM